MTTWDPANKLLNVTLSGANLTATTTASSAAGARSTTSKSTGLVYFEITIVQKGAAFLSVGIQTGVYDPSTASNIIGYDNTPASVALEVGSSGVKINGSVVGNYTSVTGDNGDLLGIALDVGNQRLAARLFHAASWGNWNDNVANSPATGFYDISSIGAAPYYIAFGSVSATESLTMDPTGAFGPIPAGYTAWDGGSPPPASSGAMGVLIVARKAMDVFKSRSGLWVPGGGLPETAFA